MKFSGSKIKKIIYILLAAIALQSVFFTFSRADEHPLTNILWDGFSAEHPGKNQWAWNDVVGWIDFHGQKSPFTVHNIKVPLNGGRITGFAKSLNVGDIALDCNLTPRDVNGKTNGCLTAPGGNWGVEWDSLTGKLSGWAWSDQIGWISFCGKKQSPAGGDPSNASTWDNANGRWKCPIEPLDYQVEITGASNIKEFTGWAWNDVVGWISFNCNNSNIGNTCGAVDYKVKVDLAPVLIPPANLTSSVFDTCPARVNCGAALNTIMWKGSKNGGAVKLQIASSNCANGSSDSGCSALCPGGCWTTAFKGPDGSVASFYSGDSSVPIKIRIIDHNGMRYFRYKIYLEPAVGSASPVVEDVIINWSP